MTKPSHPSQLMQLLHNQFNILIFVIHTFCSPPCFHSVHWCIQNVWPHYWIFNFQSYRRSLLVTRNFQCSINLFHRAKFNSIFHVLLKKYHICLHYQSYKYSMPFKFPDYFLKNHTWPDTFYFHFPALT